MKKTNLINTNSQTKFITLLFSVILATGLLAQSPTAPALGFNVFVNGGAEF